MGLPINRVLNQWFYKGDSFKENTQMYCPYSQYDHLFKSVVVEQLDQGRYRIRIYTSSDNTISKEEVSLNGIEKKIQSLLEQLCSSNLI